MLRMPKNSRTETAEKMHNTDSGTSANSSANPALPLRHVARDLGGRIDAIVDGECSIGLESTVIDMSRDCPRAQAEVLPTNSLQKCWAPLSSALIKNR